MRRSIVGLLLAASCIAPVLAGAAATRSLPSCSASRLTFALGPTRRYAVRPLRGSLTSITRIFVSNDGGVCRFPVSPSVSFDFARYGSAPGLFSATTSSGAADAAEILAAHGRTSLIAYVRGVTPTRRGYCAPRTARAIALILSQRGGGFTRYLFPRRIGMVCSNQDPAASNFGVVWQNRWALRIVAGL